MINASVYSEPLLKKKCSTLLVEKIRYVILLLLLLPGIRVNAQVTLLSTSGDGGFETSTNLAGNGWSTANGSASRGWFIGSLGASSGSRGVYTSTNSGTSTTYVAVLILHNPHTSHLYRDFTIPAGATNIVLTYKWKAGGEVNNDYMNVYVTPTSFTPSGSTSHLTTMPSSTYLVGGPYQLNSAFQTVTTTLSNTFAGTTQRLIFSWTNNNVSGTATMGGVIDEVGITYTAPCVNPTVPTIVQGSAVSRCLGDPATTLSITGTLNDATTWQWYTGSCGGTAVGTGTSISVSPTSTTTYYVRGTGGCITPGTCASTTVTVNQPVTITTQPATTLNVCSGNAINLSVAATNAGTYAWYRNGVQINNGGNVSGATTNTLQILNAGVAQSGTYHVMVNGVSPCANVQSNNSVVVVNDPVAITTQPVSTLDVCSGNAINLSVSAQNVTTYEWYKDGVLLSDGGDVSGATTDNLQITNSTTALSGTYHVVLNAYTPCANQQSNNVSVTVNDPIVINIQPAATLVECEGNAIVLNVAALNTAGYQWFGPGGQMVDGGSISGVSTPALTVSPSIAFDAGTYYVALTALPGCTDMNSANSSVTLNQPVAISLQPVTTITECEGNLINLNVAAGNNTGYLWYKDGSPLSDIGNITGSSTTSLIVNPVLAADAGTYHVVVSANTGCTDVSSTGSLVVLNPPVDITVAPPALLSVCDGNAINLSVTANNGTSYLWYKDGLPMVDVGNISGTQTAALAVTASSILDAGTYHVEISGMAPCATVTSTSLVTTDYPAAIVTQPAPLSACSEATGTMSVAATGAGLNYAWYNGTTQLTTGVTYTVSNNVLTFNNVTGLNSNDYHVIISGACGSPVISDTVTLSEDFNNIWNGATDNAWSDATNWSCGQVPIITTNVLIPTGAMNMPLVDIPGAVCNDLSVDPVASVMFTGTNNQLEVKGHIQVDPAGILDGSGGKILLSGAVQNIAGAIFGDLEIAGGNTKTLTGDVVVNGILNLNNGYLELGDFDLAMGMPWSQLGGSVSSFIITNDSGLVIGRNMGVGGNPDPAIFHVGVSAQSYTPVTLENLGVADTFSVRVMPHVYQDGYGVVQMPVPNPVIDRTWLVSEETDGGSIVNMTPQWNTADEINGFDMTHVYVAHYLNNQWTSYVSSSLSAPAAIGSNPYWTTQNNITSFSPFTVASSGQFPLEIKISGIKAVNAGSRNKVEWNSAAESKGSTYELERSIDGKVFTKIVTIKGKGAPSGYTSWDEQPINGKNYYRVKLLEADGKFSYSIIVSAAVKQTGGFVLDTYPNPVENILTLEIKGMMGKATVVVTDVSGMLVKAPLVLKNNRTEIDVTDLAQGIYILNYTDDLHNESIKINKQ